MYESTFSLTNINKLVQSGGLIDYKYQNGGTSGQLENNTAIPVANTNTKSSWEKIKEKFGKLIENIVEDFTSREGWKNRPMLWIFITIFGLLMLLGGMALSLFIFISIMLKHRKVMNINLDSRCNRDYPEYLMARSNTLSSTELPFDLLIKMPILAIISVFALFIHKKYKGNSIVPRSEESTCTVKPPTIGGTNETGTTVIAQTDRVPLPYGYISVILIFCSISLMIIIPAYISARSQLSTIRKNIQKFEKQVLDNIYINKALINTLYNEGVVPIDINEVMKKAIENVLIDKTTKEVKDIGSTNIEKLIYTLYIYQYLYDDLRDDELLNRNYRSEALNLFRYELMALPEKARIFKIADYMRSNILPNLINNAKLDNIIGFVRDLGVTVTENTIDSNKANISNAIADTNEKVGKIRIYSAWKPVRNLSISGFVAHWFIILCAIALVLFKFIKNNFLNSPREIPS